LANIKYFLYLSHSISKHRHMRRYIPLDPSRASLASMQQDGLPASIARRIWSNKCLFLLRLHVTDIYKVSTHTEYGIS